MLAQPLHPAKDVELPIGVGDRLSRLQGAAADEDGEAPEQHLLLRLQQVVTPGDGVAQGALSLGRIPRPTGEEGQPLLQTGQHRLRREHAHPRRGQLDGQGQPVQAPADLRHRRRIVVGEGEVGFDGLGARDEEPHRLVLRELLQRW